MLFRSRAPQAQGQEQRDDQAAVRYVVPGVKAPLEIGDGLWRNGVDLCEWASIAATTFLPIPPLLPSFTT